MTQQTIVSTDWLAEHLGANDIVVVDCRFDLADTEAGRRAYALDHIPNAQYVHLDDDLAGKMTGSNGRHPLPEIIDFNKILRRLGVTPAKTIVAYDNSYGIFAARLWWMMRWAGLGNCAVLDGGWNKWNAERRATTSEVATAGISEINCVVRNGLLVNAEYVMHNLRNTSVMQLVDARSTERFRGENETLDPVGGHIPGALNRFYQSNIDADGIFKSPAILRQEFATLLGKHEPATVVHQCGSGVTACHNLLAMEIAGMRGAKLYAGSWSEWCADPRRPVEL
ncbi:MAG TPA: sulfurtransferase [Rhodocyclaceae bacterium]|nr:sulfurtransferase [Rhodocyclaceae bacterium]